MAAAGSGASNTPLMTAIRSAPAWTSGRALSGVMPPIATRATPGLLHDAAQFGLPRVAIGGITPDNALPLVQAGADLIAVISGVFDAPDPAAAVRAYLSCFEEAPTP